MAESPGFASHQTHPPSGPSSLKELTLLFLRLGATAFGGPAAHIAMMDDEVVHRRRWLSREQFLDLLGATNLIPGPNSTEMAIHIGYLRAGWAGLLVAGTCFILPATVIVTTIAWAYVKFGSLPQTAGILYAVKPIVIAVILQALWRFGRAALKTKLLAVIGIISVVSVSMGVNELLVLFCAGVIAAVARWIIAHWKGSIPSTLALIGTAPLISLPTFATATGTAVSLNLSLLFLFFLKVGSVLFGSGYVLLAFLRADLVERWHWMTEGQLLDAVAIGQMTPGPVFTTATFVGYVLGGLPGAAVATIGIFLPSFVFVAISGRLVPHIRRSPTAGAALDGVNIASLALMAVVTWQLGAAAVVDVTTIALLSLSLVLLIRFRLNSAWLILGGALASLALFVLGRH